MKLYGFPPSPNTWKVRAVAAHLGLPLELEFVDLTKGARARRTISRSIRPAARRRWSTATSCSGNRTRSCSTSRASKPNSLWPNDARARADIMRWQSWQLAHWSKEGCEPLIFQRLVKKLLNMGPPDEAVVAKGTECFNREARVLDAHLAKQPYLVGNGVTLADFAVAAPLFYAKEAELPLAPYAHVRDWFGRVSALPAWRDTAPMPRLRPRLTAVSRKRPSGGRRAAPV